MYPLFIKWVSIFGNNALNWNDTQIALLQALYKRKTFQVLSFIKLNASDAVFPHKSLGIWLKNFKTSYTPFPTFRNDQWDDSLIKWNCGSSSCNVTVKPSTEGTKYNNTFLSPRDWVSVLTWQFTQHGCHVKETMEVFLFFVTESEN